MEIKFIQRGRFKGRIDLPSSLRTMEVGEIWRLNPLIFTLQTARNCCSIINRHTAHYFSVECPGLDDPFIKITRER